MAKRGIWRVGVAKFALPLPPRPPLATTTGSSSEISAMILPVWASLIMVPLGTRIIVGSMDLPEQRLAPPFSPSGAMYFFL